MKEKGLWDRTNLLNRYLYLEDKLDEIEDEFYYLKRPLIKRDSPIDDGVYIGGPEAIVVDSQKYSELKKLYRKAKNKAARKGAVEEEGINEEKILQAVYETVNEAIPKSDQEEDIDDFIKKMNLKKCGKINLDSFIRKKVGVCRHKALACGALLELFKKDGFISGKPSMDGNYRPFKKNGHAWCRYTDSKGEVYILDVSQEYMGRLGNAPEKWPYERPEDLLGKTRKVDLSSHKTQKLDLFSEKTQQIKSFSEKTQKIKSFSEKTQKTILTPQK